MLTPNNICKEGIRLVTLEDLIEWINRRLSYQIIQLFPNEWESCLFFKTDHIIKIVQSSLIDLFYEMIKQALHYDATIAFCEPLIAYHLIGEE